MSLRETLVYGGPRTFERWWDLQADWLEPPNQRRNGHSGVQCLQLGEHHLLYSKRQVGHNYRSCFYPLPRPTVLRELRAIKAIGALGIKVPEVIYCGAKKRTRQWHALLVTKALLGFCSLEDWYRNQRHLDAVQNECMLRVLGVTLCRLHLSRWQHGCLYAKHIFVRVEQTEQGPEAEIALIDLEKSRQRFTAKAAANHDLQQLHRHRQGMPDSDWQHMLQSYQYILANV